MLWLHKRTGIKCEGIFRHILIYIYIHIERSKYIIYNYD